MALFRRKKEEKKEEKQAGQEPAAHSLSRGAAVGNDLADVLRNPRITEKATAHSAIGVYTFDVSERATKRSVSRAVAAFYNVTPRLVRIVPVPTKMRRSMRTGKHGVSRGGKKAYVYLKKGETITIA